MRPGLQAEVGLQGEVPLAERQSGRSSEGYRCNMELVGAYPGEGTEWQAAYYGDCAYYDTRFSGTHQQRGTVVVDAKDRANPKFSTNLVSPAMQDPWESLSVNQERGLLAGVFVADLQGAGFFDVYDVKEDCANPKLLASIPVSGLNHEGDWSADGKTYYATGIFASGLVTAIDVSEPTAPKPITAFEVSSSIHGLSTSADGNRLYVADIAGQNDAGNGLTVVDVSEIQARKATPRHRVVGSVTWEDGATAQHTIPVTIKGRPHLVFVDELGSGGPRMIDLSDETKPRVVSKLKTEIQMPEHADRAAESACFGDGGLCIFGYNSHYCSVDKQEEPSIVACSTFESGMRVFDIREPTRPKEIGYFNPGGNGGQPVGGSFRNGGTSGYTSARPRIVAERGEIWFTDHDKGFFIARFTNGTWPFEADSPAQPAQAPAPAGGSGPAPAPASAPTGPAQDLGMPSSRNCVSKRNFAIRLRAPRGQRLRSAKVYVNGKRVRVTRRAGRLRARVDLRGLPRGIARVRIVAKTRSGRTVKRTRRYRTCTPRAARS